MAAQTNTAWRKPSVEIRSDPPGLAIEPRVATAIKPAPRTIAWLSPAAAPEQFSGTAETAAFVNPDIVRLIPSPKMVVPPMMCDQNGIGSGAAAIHAVPPAAMRAPVITSVFVPIVDVSPLN